MKDALRDSAALPHVRQRGVEASRSSVNALDLRRELLLGLIVAVSFCVLMPTHFTVGRFSIPEAGLAVLAVVLLVTYRRPGAHAPVPTAFVVLLGLMLLSALWSFDAWDTVRMVVGYAAIACASWIIASRVRIGVILWGIVFGGVTALAASLLFLSINPEMALYYGTTGLQGVYENRNTLGVVMTQALPAALALPVPRWYGWLLKLALGGLFFAATLLTLSKTSLLVAVLVTASWVALILLRRGRWAIAAVGALAVAGLVALLANWRAVLALLGKDETLNGRVEIWNAVLSATTYRPLFGFGWSNSWPAGSPHSSAVADALDGTVVYHAHNEILNWLITTGVIGAVLIISLYGLTVWGGIRAWHARIPGGEWVVLGAIAVISRGLAEISETNAQGWLIFTLLIFSATRSMAATATTPISLAVLLPERSVRPGTASQSRDAD